MSTVGVSWLAYCMPSISCLPPAPESPVAGSKTPIFTTLSPDAPDAAAEAAAPPAAEPLLPQAARDAVIARVSAKAKTFFILSSSCQCTEHTGTGSASISETW